MVIQRQNIVDEGVDLAGAVMGLPRTVRELRIILEDFQKDEPNEWFPVEEAQKAVRNLYFVLFGRERRPDFDDWNKIARELTEELDHRAENGEEEWKEKTLLEVEEEVAKAWEEAEVVGEENLGSRALNSRQLEVLLRDLDDHLIREGRTDEAIQKLVKKYGLEADGKELLAQAVTRKIEIQKEIEAGLVRKGKTIKDAQKIADTRSDAQLKVEARLREETTKPREEIRELARKVAEVVVEPDLKKEEVKLKFEDPEIAAVAQDLVAERRIEIELGNEANPRLTRLAVEEERKLREVLGERSEEIVAKVVKDGEAKGLGRELEMTAGIARMERQVEAKAEEVTAQLAEVLEVRSEEGVEKIRQITEERVRGKISGEIVTLNQPTVRATKTMVQELDEVVEGGIPTNKAEQANSVLRDINTGLEQYQNQYKEVLGGWQETLVKWKVLDMVVVANPGVSVAVAEKFAGEVAKVYGPDSGVLETERQVWREANLAGEITPLQEAELRALVYFSRSTDVSIPERLAAYEAGQRELDTSGSVEAQGFQAVLGEASANPGLAAMMERARQAGGNFVQNLAIERIRGIKGLEGLANLLGGPANNTGIGFAKEAIGLLKNSESLAGGLRAILGLAGGGGGAAGAAGTGRVLLGLAARLGLGATGPVGWVVGLAGGILGKIGLKAGLKGLIKQAPALLGKAAGVGAKFVTGLMGMISTAGLAIPSAAIWGPIVAILVFVLIIIGPLISAMVPPGRGTGGAVVDQTTLNGGYLAAAPWSGDINELPDSCPPDSLPIGGTVTQGPDAIGCSHSGYKNVIDVAGGEVDLKATHKGVVEAVVNMGDGYGQYVDIRGRCGTTTFVTRYAHMIVGSAKVNVEEKVTEETILGKSDSSGNSSGTHLHYEIRGLTTEYFHDWERCCIDNGIACPN